MSTIDRTTALILACLVMAGVSAAQAASAPAGQAGAATAPAASAPIMDSPPHIQPATAPVLAAAPATAPTTAPAASMPASSHAVVRDIILQFDGMPFNTVVRKFIEQTAHKTVLGDINIEGNLTFVDSQPYSYDEAFDMLNLLLAMRGQSMVENGRFISVEPLGRSRPKILQPGQDDNPKVRPSEFVTEFVPLKYMDPQLAVKIVDRMINQQYGMLAPLPKGKGILITEQKETIDYVRKLLNILDDEKVVEQGMRSFQLKKASAAGVAEILNNLFGPNRARRMVWNQDQHRMVPDAGDPGDFLGIVSDPRINTLFITGSADRITMAEQMIQTLDVDVEIESGDFRIFELKNARAEELANTIRQLLPRQGNPAPGGSRGRSAAPARVVANAATNSIIVAASADEMNSVEKLIRDIDQKTVSVSGAKIFKLEFADAQQLAPIIAAACNKRDGAGRTISTVSVSVEPRGNSLVIAGATGDIQDAAKLIAELDRTGQKDAREVRVIQLTAGDAREMADSLQRLFSQTRGGRGGQGAGAGSLRVEAEPSTNSLIIAAGPGDWPVITDILDKLKASVGPATAVSTRVVPLQNAKASELADTIRRAYVTAPRSSGRGQGQAAAPVVITASDRTNSLLISATQADHDAIGKLIETLDVPLDDTKQIDPVIIVRIKSADAAKLAGTLTAMMPKNPAARERELVIQADPTNQMLLVRAPESQRKMIEDLISKLDEETTKAARELRTVKLKGASATSMAAMLGQLYQNVVTANVGRRNPSANPAAEAVIVTAAPDDRTLIVEAPKNRIDEVISLAQSLDMEQVPTQLEVRTYKLANGTATDAAPSLARLFADQQRNNRGAQANTPTEPQPRFEGDMATNQLMVAASARQFEIIEPLIRKLNDKASLAGQTRTFRLKFARSTEIVAVLQSMLSEAAQGAPRRGGTGAEATRVAAMSDGNAVIVQGLPEKLTLAEELINALDTEDTSPAATIQIVQLKNSQAKTLADAVNASLAQSNAGNRPGRGASEVTVVPEPNSNSLLVRAPSERMPAVLEMVKKLDAGGTMSTQVRIFPLESSEASELAVSIDKFFKDINNQARQAKGDAQPFSVTAEPRTNSLIVSTTPVNFAVLENLLKDLDKPATATGREAQFYWLDNADPYDVALKLSAMFADRKAADKPYIEGDSSTNSLTVIARDADLKAIEPVIAKLDTAARNQRIRVFPLEKVQAERMAEAIKRMYGQMTDAQVEITDKLPRHPATESTGEFQLFPAPAGGDFTGNPTAPATQPAGLIAKALEPAPSPASAPASQPASGPAGGRPKVVIAVDKAANSLIVSGARQDIDNIQSLIEQLAATTDKDAEIRVFKIENADPVPVARTLNDLFNPRPLMSRQLNAGQNQPNQGNQPNATGRGARGGERNNPSGPMTPAVQGTESTVTIVANVRTKSLIVRAKPLDFDMIEGLVKQLDQQSIIKTEVKVFTLKNTDATEMAANLRELFKIGAQAGTRTGRGGLIGPNQMPAGPNGQDNRADMIRMMLEMQGADGMTSAEASNMVNLSANRATNSVIVSAPPEEMELISRIISELDQSAGLAHTASIRMYPLKQAEVAATVAELQQLFVQTARGGRGGTLATQGPLETPVIIAGDDAAHMVIVSAPADKHELIAKAITEIDQAQVGGLTSIRVYHVANADANSISAALTRVLGDSGGADARGRRGGSTAGLARISADTSSNSLVVRATQEDHDRIAKLLEDMDKAPGSQLAVQTIQLVNADAANAAAMLTRLFAGGQLAGGRRGPNQGASAVQPVIIEGDRGGKLLTVRADDETFKRIQEVAKKIDDANVETATNTHILALKNGDAATMADMVKDLYAQVNKTNKNPEPLAVSADERANALILQCGNDTYQKVAEWVTKVEDMKPAKGNLRIITLPTADPAEVDNAIRQMFNAAPAAPGGAGAGAGNQPRRGGPAAGGARGSDQVQTTVLPQQRAILVNANDEDYDAILKLVAKMEQAAQASKRDIKVFTLKNTSNTRVAVALEALYRLTAGRTASVGDQVTVQAMPQTNAIIVAASKVKMEQVASLIEQLDKPENSSQLEFRIYPLTNTTPTKALPLLKEMVTTIQKAKPDETINIQANEQTRSLIVSGRGGVFDQVAKFIAEIDKPAVNAKSDVLVLQLKHTDAARLAVVLNEMLRPDPAGQVTPEARALQEQVRLLNVRSSTKDQLLDLDLTKPIKITADPAAPQGSNSLLLESTADNIKALRAIVELMDVVPMTDGVAVRLVHLQNGDAQSIMTILKDVFTQGKTLAGKAGSSVAGRGEPDSTSGKALVNALNVSADVRTNTLVVSGVEESVALAELLIKDLDRNEGKIITEVRLFKLANADAAKLVPVLQSVFTEQAAAIGTEGLRTQVTRLKTVLDKESGHSSEMPKARAALAIQADPSTNILIVAARSDVMPLIADVIKTMDIPGAGSMNTVRIFPLENADATRMQGVVNSLYTGGNAKLIRDEDKPTVAVDTRTNALVVSASDKTFLLLELLLKKLDVKQPIDLRNVRLVTLKNAETDMLAPTLQKMMDARVQRLASLGVKDADAVKVIVISDTRSNSLIVGGSAEGFELVKSLAEQLDTTSPALGGQVQMFPLVNGNASAIAATLANLFNQRYQAAVTKDVARQKPIIMADLRTNALLVAANEDDTKILKALLEKLDVKLGEPSVLITVIPLKFNDAGTVGPTIKTIFASRLKSMTPNGQTPDPASVVDVAVEPLSNAMIVMASKENLEEIKSLLARVDVEPPTDNGVIKIFSLTYADATTTANLLSGLIKQGLYKPSLVSATNNPALTAREKVSITSDVRTNSIIVSASKENLAVIEQIIKKVDTDVSPLLGEIQIYTLKRADATKLAPVLQQFFMQKRTGELAVNPQEKTLPMTVIADGRTNTLLVAGGRENFAAVKEMVDKLDGGDIAALTDFRVFNLTYATAGIIQPMLQQLFAQRIVRGTNVKDPVTFLADTKNNAIIVGASAEDMKLAESIIKKMDTDEKNGFAVKVFMLKKADAKTAAATIRGIITPTAGAGAGTSAAAATSGVTISSDDRTNSLIVSAGENDMQRIAELVNQIDTDQISKITEIRVFTLVNADAKELAAILTDVLTSKPKSPITENPNRQPFVQFITHTREGQDLMTSAMQEGIQITPDSRTNSVVVSASLDNMPLLEALILALDSTSPRVAEIRVFPLQNGDATRMATVLMQLFRLQASAGAAAAATGANARAVSYTLVSTQPANGDLPSATVGNAEQSALNVTVDTRTNSLLVGGTKQYVDLASKIIEELDASPAQERRSEVYRLRNARAGDVQTAVSNFLTQERQLVTSTLGSANLGSAQRLLEQQASVVAVPSEGQAANANTLLISASPRYFDIIENMIKELDQPQPQVLIQCLLAEVTIDDEVDLGMDAQYTKKVDGNNTVQTGTKFGIATEVQNLNGFTFSLTGGDFTFFLRALQDQHRLEVLDRPQIMAQDNQTANINIGQRVPFIVDTQTTESGSTFSTIQYQPVGIQLNVTPRINPDGLVKMDISPTISSLSKSTVQISPGVNATIIDERTAKTTLSVQDGHTVVLGGLITTQDEETVNKVPVLGDIPVLGWLFKKSVKTKTRQELLIILTPHVMRNVVDNDKATRIQADRFKDLLQQGNKDELQKQLFPSRYFSGGPAGQPASSPADSAGDDAAPAGAKILPADISTLPASLPAPQETAADKDAAKN